MSKSSRTCALILSVAAAAACAARAATPEKLFEEIFGAEAKQVAASASKLDDAEFAEKLLKSSQTLTEAPDFRIYLYQKICEFGLANPKGYAQVQTALSMLEAAAPDRKAEWDDKRLELYLLSHRNALGAEKRNVGEAYITQAMIVGDNRAAQGKWRDALGFYQQAATTAGAIRSLQKDRAAEKVAYAEEMRGAEELVERVKKEPDNAALRASLVKLCVELDAPALAVPYLDPTVGEVWRSYVPLAAQEPATQPIQVCLELGNWYKSLAFSCRPRVKPLLAKRTKEYYRTYLTKLRAEGATVHAFAEAKEKVNVSLREIGVDKLDEELMFRDPAVQKAFDKAVAYLWSQQAGDGSWKIYSVGTGLSYSDAYYNVRPTSAVMLALFDSGAKLADERMARGMKYLDMNLSPLTEAIAVRCWAWERAGRQRSGAYAGRFATDVKALLIGTTNGGYGYTVHTYTTSYNYYSWAAAWGVEVGAASGVKVPRRYWQLILDYWVKQQKADGGWASSISPLTTARGEASALWTTMGLSNVAVALKNLYSAEMVKRLAGPECEPLRKGLAWMDKNFSSMAALKDRYYYSYSYDPEYVVQYDGLWQLSLLCQLTGRKQIGKVDWFPTGATYLAGSQAADGSWSGVIGTARAVCFLINGQRLEDQGLGLPAAHLSPVGPVTPKLPATMGAVDPAKQAALKKIELMKARLTENPDNEAVAQELVRLYLVEMQDPASAALYADQTGKPQTKKLLDLAAKGPAALNDAEAQELGDWYNELAGGSSIPGRKHALTQAAACYKRFLDTHAAGDAAKLKVKIALQKIEQALGEIK